MWFYYNTKHRFRPRTPFLDYHQTFSSSHHAIATFYIFHSLSVKCKGKHRHLMPFQVVRETDLSINTPCTMPFYFCSYIFQLFYIINKYINEYNVSMLHFSLMCSKQLYIVFVYTVRSNVFLLMFYCIYFYFVKKIFHNYQ